MSNLPISRQSCNIQNMSPKSQVERPTTALGAEVRDMPLGDIDAERVETIQS